MLLASGVVPQLDIKLDKLHAIFQALKATGSYRGALTSGVCAFTREGGKIGTCHLTTDTGCSQSGHRPVASDHSEYEDSVRSFMAHPLK